MPDVIFNPVILRPAFRPSILNTRIACSFISGKHDIGEEGMEISWNSSSFLKERTSSIYPNVGATSTASTQAGDN